MNDISQALTDALNTLVIGGSQGGKSTSVLALDFVPTVEAGYCSTFLFDPHNDLGQKAAEWATWFCPERLLVERLGNLDWVCSAGFIEPSKSLNDIVKESENRNKAKIFAEVLASSQGASLKDQPLKKEWIHAALMLWLFQHDPKPLWFLPHAFRPNTPYFNAMIANCENMEMVWKFEMLTRFNSTVALYNAVGPSARLLDELFNEMAFLLRTEATFDLESFIEHQGVFILMGGGDDAVGPDTIRALMRAFNHKIDEIVIKRWHALGVPTFVKVYIDEAANFNLLGYDDAERMGQTMKMGRSSTVISQTPDFGDERTNDSIDQNCPRKIYHRCGSAKIAKLCAENLKTTIDPNRVKQIHTTKRQKNVGFDTTTQTTKGKYKGSGGEGESENTQVIRTPIYEELTEERIELMPLSEQNELNEADLLGGQRGLQIGECFFSNGGYVSRMKVKKLEDVWTWPGLGKEKLEELIELRRQQGAYKKVTSLPWKTYKLPEPPPAPPSPPAPPKPPKPNPAKTLGKKRVKGGKK